MVDNKQLLFSVTIHDCKVQTFRSGGPGGQHQNKTESGVRIIHEPSGARGESREERSQLQNKKIAFRRMAQTPQFKWWVEQERRRLEGEMSIEEAVAESMTPDKIKVEVQKNGLWVEE
jgi:protein subunit release factor B